MNYYLLLLAGFLVILSSSFTLIVVHLRYVDHVMLLTETHARKDQSNFNTLLSSLLIPVVVASWLLTN